MLAAAAGKGVATAAAAAAVPTFAGQAGLLVAFGCIAAARPCKHSTTKQNIPSFFAGSLRVRYVLPLEPNCHMLSTDQQSNLFQAVAHSESDSESMQESSSLQVKSSSRLSN